MESKEKMPLKDKLNIIYYGLAIATTVGGGAMYLGKELGILGEKQEQQNVQVNARIDKVENKVDVSNVKLDTLLQRPIEKQVLYSKTTEYPAESSKPSKTIEVSNSPIPKGDPAPVAQAPAMAENDNKAEEDIFVTSDGYDKREEIKMEALKKKNIKYVGAVFYGDQSVGDNSTVSFRFPEAVVISNVSFERNTIFKGIAHKKGEKFYFEISDINDESVNCKVYDNYKIEGLNYVQAYKDNQKILIGFDY